MSILTTLILLTVIVGVLVVASLLLYFLYRLISSGEAEEAKEEFMFGRIQGARQNYDDSLENLKRDPHDERLRQTAYEHGMRYGELMNKHLQTTLYEEKDILQQINAVIEGRDPYSEA